MGRTRQSYSLTYSTAGIVGFDTSIFIYLFEDHPKYADTCEKLLLEVQEGHVQGIFANIGLIELNTGPKKFGKVHLTHYFRHHLETMPNLTLSELNQPVLEIASDLRAKYSLGTPGAIHLASAIVYGADIFVTNDKALQKVTEIQVKTLDEI